MMVRHTIPLGDAALCISCDSVWNTREGADCPRCGSRTSWFIARNIQPLRPREHQAATKEGEGK